MMNLRIDKESAEPIFRQIVDVVLSGIASGRMNAGEQLPTIRELAVRLDVNPNTVAKAYSRLRLAGAVESRPGSGVFVREGRVKQPSKRTKERAVRSLCRDFAARGELRGISVDELIECLRGMRG